MRTVAQAEPLLRERVLASYERNGFGLYVVTLKANGERLGMCGLIRRAGLDDVGVGYAYPPEQWGKGYASEAAPAVVQYGYENLRLLRIVAIGSPHNARAIHRI